MHAYLHIFYLHFFLLQANLPKEISDYLNKMCARVPRIKPGRATVDYLTKIQTSTRFWGRCPVSLKKVHHIVNFFVKIYPSSALCALLF
jgi:preprotein translocase subunit SecY